MILKRSIFKSSALIALMMISACSQRKYQRSDDTVAIVNNQPITLEAYQAQLMPIQSFQGVDTRTQSGKRKILDDMVLQELIFQEAIKKKFHLKNLSIKHAVVDAYLKDKFQAEIERVTESTVRKYYDDNQKRLDRVRASHIIIKIDSDVAQKTQEEVKAAKEKVRQTLQPILQDIKSGAISFEDAAKKHSQDGTSKKGGDLGYFTKGQMVGPFQDKAFAMQNIGEVSDLVETKFGYHIIKLTGQQIGYPYHRDRIRKHLIKTAIEEKTNIYKSALKNDNDTEIFYDKLPKDTLEN